MFGIGMQEIVLICVIALIVVGPKRLPEIARALGKGYGEFRRTFDEMKRNVETEFNTDEIRRSFSDIPPSPQPAEASGPQPESPLTVQLSAHPEGRSYPYPYPYLVDAAPPPAEQPVVHPDPASTQPGGRAHG